MTGQREETAQPVIPRSWWHFAVVLLVLRMALLVLSVPPNAPMTGDEGIYDHIARNVLRGNGIEYKGEPWVWKPPGWPATLAGVYGIAGDTRRTVVLVQGLFDCVTILAGAWLALRIDGRRLAWLLGLLIVALWPPYFRESRFLQTEPLFTACMAVTLVSFVRLRDRPSPLRGALFGAAAGLAAMVRPTGIVAVVGLLLGWLLIARPRIRPASLAAAALGLGLVLLPWTLRNASVFHSFIPISTGTGEYFYMGAAPQTDGRWVPSQWTVLSNQILETERKRLGRDPDPLERDRAFLRAGIGIWRQDPAGSLARVAKRLGRLCLLPVGGEQTLVRFGFLVVLIGLYGLALRRVARSWGDRRGEGALPAALMAAVVVYAVVSAAFYTNSRYFEPVRLIVLVLAASEVSRSIAGVATSAKRARGSVEATRGRPVHTHG